VVAGCEGEPAREDQGTRAVLAGDDVMVWVDRRGWNVTSRPNKDEFEPTSGPSVSSMACVGNCPTLLVEGESHQHINPSAKCISTPGLTLLHEARTKA
jgi:hypothetical protein